MNTNTLRSIAHGEDALVGEIRDMLNSGNNLPLAIQQNIGADAVKAVINRFEEAHLP